MESQQEKLLPCPFCGRDAVLKHDITIEDGQESGFWFIHCASPICDCCVGYGTNYTSAEQVIRRWNNRQAVLQIPAATTPFRE